MKYLVILTLLLAFTYQIPNVFCFWNSTEYVCFKMGDSFGLCTKCHVKLIYKKDN